MTPLRVLKLFENIPGEDLQLLFLNSERNHHPKNFIITHFPVPPLCIRPSINSGGRASNDALTNFIKAMMEYNEKINQCIQKGKEPNNLMNEWEYL